MPTFRYGARQFQTSLPNQAASTTANVVGFGFQYMPAIAGKAAISGEAESIKGATLLFPSSIQTAASTAAAGSLLIVLTQFNSLGNSQNSAVLYNQVTGNSQAANVPLDVSTLCNWTLAPGDSVVLGANTNTIGIPVYGGVVFSAWVDAVTAQ